jgi:hypothetical protein
MNTVTCETRVVLQFAPSYSRTVAGCEPDSRRWAENGTEGCGHDTMPSRPFQVCTVDLVAMVQDLPPRSARRAAAAEARVARLHAARLTFLLRWK